MATATVGPTMSRRRVNGSASIIGPEVITTVQTCSLNRLCEKSLLRVGKDRGQSSEVGVSEEGRECLCHFLSATSGWST